MSPLGVVQVALIFASAYPIALLATWVDDLSTRRTPAAATADPLAIVGAMQGAADVETPALSGNRRCVSVRSGYLPWDD